MSDDWKLRLREAKREEKGLWHQRWGEGLARIEGAGSRILPAIGVVCTINNPSAHKVRLGEC